MWVKTQGTLRTGERWVGPAMVQLQPETVTVWKHSCEKCGHSTTIFVTNPKEPVRAWCCGKWVTPEPEKTPQRDNVFSRLMR
jgi:hypothetical protein